MDVLWFGTYTFPIAITTFKYLGIQVYRSQPDQLEGNVVKATAALRSSIAFWTSLPLSVMGRVAISKMVVLPPLLYFFVNLPIVIPQHIFQMLNTLLVELIWASGRRRIGLRKLQFDTKDGGLGVPDYKAYYLASQLQWLLYWTAGKNLQEIGYTSSDIDRGRLHSITSPN